MFNISNIHPETFRKLSLPTPIKLPQPCNAGKYIEALGICGAGEAGPYVEGATRIALDGELPLNTYGGQLSAGRMHGYWLVHEACLQLRGEAGARQVQGTPEVAIAAGGGGPIAGCLLLTR